MPVFSFEKLHGVDTQFGPEMKSTGEVLGIAPNFHDALLKGLIGAGYTFKTPGPASCCIFTVKDSDKPEFVDIAWKLKSMGYKLYGTSGTCAWLNKHMVPCNEVRNMSGEAPNIVDLLQSGLVDYVFSTSAKAATPNAIPSACAARPWSSASPASPPWIPPMRWSTVCAATTA